MPSIKQNPNISARLQLPDLRNLGVCLRILLLVNLIALMAAILFSASLNEIIPRLAELSVGLQPVLLVSILLLYAAYPQLSKLPYFWAIAAILFIELTLGGIAHRYAPYLLGFETVSSLPRTWLLTAIVCAIVFYYFHLRQRALTPAVTEARLQALQARIRPHFLFNSINAVLSILRSDPKRAETALMDMADLFRVLMTDNRELVPLAQELALSRQYLALEKLRLDERLNVVWQVEEMPPDALIPPLVLQPLLENAVYHGIESMPEGGTITIVIQASRDEVQLHLTNPYRKQGDHHSGNKMALSNIRERLALHFDAEAQLSHKVTAEQYQVHITLPYHRQAGQ